MHHGVDQRQVGERLREVKAELAGMLEILKSDSSRPTGA